MVLKDEVLKGLRFELSRDEIRKIYQSDSYEKYDYYDFSVLIKGIEKTINNEIEFDDFIDWCILIANAFNYIPARYNERICVCLNGNRCYHRKKHKNKNAYTQ